MIAISCYFGAKLSGVYDAPRSIRSLFFSNNSDMRSIVEEKGWEYHLLAQMPPSIDPRISSLQSKFVKFLQFNFASVNIFNDEDVLYFDHKFEVTENHVETARFLCSSSVLIRNTPKIKNYVDQEIEEAERQKRYRDKMPETVDWVKALVASGQYSRQVRIMNTGLIYYRNPERIRKLRDAAFDTCWHLGQPECQIIWAMLSQKFQTDITKIEWSQLAPNWKAPSLKYNDLRYLDMGR